MPDLEKANMTWKRERGPNSSYQIHSGKLESVQKQFLFV